MSITIHFGLQGEEEQIFLECMDGSGGTFTTELRLIVANRDKPRSFKLIVAGVPVFERDKSEMRFMALPPFERV